MRFLIEIMRDEHQRLSHMLIEEQSEKFHCLFFASVESFASTKALSNPNIEFGFPASHNVGGTHRKPLL
jgi:hypothetical protein